MMNHATTDGAVLIVKMPARDINGVRGRLPIAVTYDLHRTPWAPVVRLIMTIYDDSPYPLLFETFFNIADAEQLRNLEDLTAANALRILFYDENCTHRLNKIVTQSDDPC